MKEREARRAGQAQAADRQIKALDEAGGTVETDDADTQVFADAEGTGSMGRELESEEGETGQATNGDTAEGVIHDEDGQPHIDLQA
jgi:hypothetical protein